METSKPVVQTASMANKKRKLTPKTVLKLPDLEQSKSAVLNSLTSRSSQRSYDHAIREFIDWYCSEPLGHQPSKGSQGCIDCGWRSLRL